MKSILGIFILFLMSQISIAQETSRRIVHGQAVNDSIKVENVIVFNISAKLGAVTKLNGNFEIHSVFSNIRWHYSVFRRRLIIVKIFGINNVSS